MIKGKPVLIIQIFSIVLLSFLHSHMVQAAQPIEIELRVNFGKDLGNNFGTLFEIHDLNGRLIMGAGFVGNYNTYNRSDRYQLQFFARPASNKQKYEMKAFPGTGNHIPSNYLYDFADHLYTSYVTTSDLEYSSSENSWRKAPDNINHAVHTVRGKKLIMLDHDLYYDDQLILKAKKGCQFTYYANATLIFSCNMSKDKPGFLAAVPWSPYQDDLTVQWDKVKIQNYKYPKEHLYAHGNLDQEVIACSNYGGCYNFNEKGWKIIRQPDKNVSFQIYSMINYNDQLLMGQYPTGFFYSYDGHTIQQLKNSPPVPSGASPHVRELQSTSIYRGELFAGVWPWAELWHLDPDNDSWTKLGRLFSSPKVTDNPVHPYEEEASAAGAIFNALGQRITSLIPNKDRLIMGTSWKIGENRIDSNQFSLLNDQQINEYGALHQLMMPGNLNVLFHWQDRPIIFRFSIADGMMRVWQDYSEIGSIKFD